MVQERMQMPLRRVLHPPHIIYYVSHKFHSHNYTHLSFLSLLRSSFSRVRLALGEQPCSEGRCNSWQYPESSVRSSPDSATPLLKDDLVIHQVSRGGRYPLGLERSVANGPVPLPLIRLQESEIVLLKSASPLNAANGRQTLLSPHAACAFLHPCLARRWILDLRGHEAGFQALAFSIESSLSSASRQRHLHRHRPSFLWT